MEVSGSSRLPARYKFREFQLTHKGRRKAIPPSLFAQSTGDNHSKKYHAALRRVEASLCRLDEEVALMLRRRLKEDPNVSPDEIGSLPLSEKLDLLEKLEDKRAETPNHIDLEFMRAKIRECRRAHALCEEARIRSTITVRDPLGTDDCRVPKNLVSMRNLANYISKARFNLQVVDGVSLTKGTDLYEEPVPEG